MSHFTYVYDGWKLIDEPRHEGNAALDSLQANPHSGGGDRLPGRKRSQYGSNGTEEAYYVQGPGADEPLTRNPTIGQISYYSQDGNANVTALTDSSGNIIEHYAYDPFGNVTVTSSTGAVQPGGSSIGNRFMFTGREYIAEIGLYDYRNRVYSPGLGRFLQTDPIRFSGQDINIYRFCGNGAINWGDPMGLYHTFSGGDYTNWNKNFADKYKDGSDFKKQWDQDEACPDEHHQTSSDTDNPGTPPDYNPPPGQANNVAGGRHAPNQPSDPEGQGGAEQTGILVIGAGLAAGAAVEIGAAAGGAALGAMEGTVATGALTESGAFVSSVPAAGNGVANFLSSTSLLLAPGGTQVAAYSIANSPSAIAWGTAALSVAGYGTRNPPANLPSLAAFVINKVKGN